MPIPYSKRRKVFLAGGVPDVLTYDLLPPELRAQVIHIWRSSIGPYFYKGRYAAAPFWDYLSSYIAREHGILKLDKYSQTCQEGCETYLLTGEDTDKVLDIIEESFAALQRVQVTVRDPYTRKQAGIDQSATSAINELNQRFREHALGYRFEDGMLMRVDSEVLHADVVKPALALISAPEFSGALDEFAEAYENYRHGRHEDALTAANRAFESTMKAICDLRNIAYDKHKDTASRLIDHLVVNGVIDSWISNHLSSVRATLETGLPVVRNKKGGHGQGAAVLEVPDYFVSYALHLAATNIVFLINAHKATSIVGTS